LITEELVDFLGLALIGIGLLVPTLDYGLKRRISRYSSIVVASFALTLSMILFAITFGGQTWFLYSGTIKMDVASAFLFVVISLVALLVTIASFKQTQKWNTTPSYFSLILLITVGTYYIASVNDLVLLLASWALVSVASYALIGIKKDQISLEGAAKYALMGIVASGFILFGIAILVGLTGTTEIDIIQQLISASNPQMVLLAVIMFIVGFGFKVGIVPFHAWLPDVYGSVDPLLVSFVASAIKISGMAAIFRILVPLSSVLGERWLMLFAFLSMITMTFGNVAALIQKNVQKIMAYSSLAHAGYILIGFAAVTTATGAALGIQGVILHLLAYILAIIGIFVGFSYLKEKGIGTDLNDLHELWSRMPILTVSLVILLLSLIGTPPLLGFWSKFIYLIVSTLEVAPWLSVIAIVNTGISIGFYGQIIRHLILKRRKEEVSKVIVETRNPQLFVVVSCAILSLVLGLVLGPIFSSIITI
jgi:proton-translocating NADH-quinone oxidoreductase chain N